MPYFYVSPATLLLVLLMLFPMVMVFKYSLMDGAIMKKDAAFAGFQNYLTIFENPVFWQSVVQTLYFTIMSVVFHFIIGLAFALLLNTNRVDPLIRSILRVLFILPWLFTAVIIAIIWRLLLDPNGVVNSVLMALHIINFKVEWFSSTRTAIHALTFANIWAGYPLYMVSLLAGLQGISKELYEAAGIDGANGLQKFWYITIPQLMPIIISIALLDFIWTMQVFPLVWMTTGGGPIYSTEVLSTFTYKLAFSQYEFSLASASAMIILIISMSVTYFYIKHQQRR
ncbi:Binding-protein-dependent transport system inner membrane component family protein (plasmid) [Rhizobium leguminosarum]|uniref:Binding-protein-dependent transport system inner membrane component family protein n=1 Tax=Rhizobium leguminosarum TaxID=384 RepID=A0A2Z4YMW5_RHILE|nr:Binding-protein-dependent transport system inner membrane component family protein [Rhizobium leguminosarum]